MIEFSFTATAGGSVFDRTEKPVVAFVGEGQVVKGLDDALLATEVGDKKKIVLSPGQAFGDRREDLIRLVPLEQFRRQGIDPAAGMPVELDGVPGRVQSVSGGRVRVDFNHELAGKTVEYEFSVEKKYVSAAEKIAGLQEHLLPGCTASLEGGVVSVAVPAGVAEDADYAVRKLRFVTQATRFVEGVKKVSVLEDYEGEDTPTPA